MRRKRVLPKERRLVAVPTELCNSLREVNELIRQARHDPEIILDYDDAIQVGSVCGGLSGDDPQSYRLTFFPDGDQERGRWHLTLHQTEIEDIGAGRMTEVILHCCTSADCRTKFREADRTCFHCDYYDDPAFGTFEFPAAESALLARGVSALSRDSNQDEVIAILGAPDWSGGGGPKGSKGFVWPWIKYRRPDCQLRFEFSRDLNHIRNVTVLEANWEPGK